MQNIMWNSFKDFDLLQKLNLKNKFFHAKYNVLLFENVLHGSSLKFDIEFSHI